MTARRTAGRSDDEAVLADMLARLRVRLPEIETAIDARIRSDLPHQVELDDAEYLTERRAAIRPALEYALSGIEFGLDSSRDIPTTLIVQARRAERSGVSLETVLRRYVSGDSVFADHMMAEGEKVPITTLRRILQIRAVQLERVIAAVASEYTYEMELVCRSPEQRRAEDVRRLLDGEYVPLDAFDYRFETSHLGVIAHGANAKKAVHRLATAFNREVLLVQAGEQTVWAWLGGQRPLSHADIRRVLPDEDDAGVSLAVGEPAEGLEGWRDTHRQAQAASLVALPKPKRLTAYADVLLDAAALQSPTLERSLKQIFLSPIADERDGGKDLRATLRAYYETGRNIATAAIRLGVNRHTVERRLSRVEQLLGRELRECNGALELALRLETLHGDNNGPKPAG